MDVASRTGWALGGGGCHGLGAGAQACGDMGTIGGHSPVVWAQPT
jgi:hypothetical protein